MPTRFTAQSVPASPSIRDRGPPPPSWSKLSESSMYDASARAACVSRLSASTGAHPRCARLVLMASKRACSRSVMSPSPVGVGDGVDVAVVGFGDLVWLGWRPDVVVRVGTSVGSVVVTTVLGSLVGVRLGGVVGVSLGVRDGVADGVRDGAPATGSVG